MIQKVTGNLLDADVEALVNTVNTAGIMGRGIALQFKRAFPANFKEYERACREEKVVPGKMFIHDQGGLQSPRYIINFPTKRHWKGKSKIEDIKSGLTSLVSDIKRLEIKSIALPPLGCGNGGLNWLEVFPLIQEAFKDIPEVKVLIFEPAGAPEAREMRNETERPAMTIGRAAILGLMRRYNVPGYLYRLSLLEIQKLAYFLQCAGQPLKLIFKADIYGPYADNLRHVLNHIEGHFVQGFGDGKSTPTVQIDLLPEAAIEAEEFLSEHEDTLGRFTRVTDLIDGFETPYGMELLATVHWVTTQCNDDARLNPELAIQLVQGWSERKAKLFKESHIILAWNHLKEKGWI